jgi:O-antigen ligase
VATRQPHNTHLSVLLRLGLLGFLVWAVMLWRIFRVLLGSVREIPVADPRHGLRLWFLVFFLLGVFETTVQPWLEFSYGAIPFFLLAGFGMTLAGEKRA